MFTELARTCQQALDVLGDGRVALVEDLGDQLGVPVGAEHELGQVPAGAARRSRRRVATRSSGLRSEASLVWGCSGLESRLGGEARHPGNATASDGEDPDAEQAKSTDDGHMTVRGVIERHGHFAHGGDPYETMQAWIEAGFGAHEVDEWLNARCFDPGSARDLADAGVSPAEACMKTNAGRGDYTDMVGFKVSAGDLEVEEARDLLGVT